MTPPHRRRSGCCLALAAAVSLAVPAGASELFFDFDVAADEIAESGDDDLGAVCRDLAGLSAVRRGAINLEPTVRGLWQEQVAVFVDGTRTFAAGPARLDSDLSHVNPHAVENLKVVRGPYALTWGAGTLSALEVETFKPPIGNDDVRGSFDLSFGSNAEDVDAFGNVWHSHDRWTWVLDFARRTGNDYESGDGSEVPADYESNTFRSYWAVDLTEELLFTFNWNYQEQFDLDSPGSLIDTTFSYARSHATDLTWSGEGRISEVYGQLYSNRKDHRMNGDEKPTAFLVDLPAESNTFGGRLRVGLAGKRLSGSLGLDYYEFEQTATRRVSHRGDGALLFEDAVGPDATIENLGVWAQVVYGVGRARLGATVRVDGVEASKAEGDSGRRETHVSAAFSGRFELDAHWTLSAGVGRAVRAATVLERYSDHFPSARFQVAAEVLGDPRLDAEESLEWDLGLRGRWGGFQLEVGGFYRTIDEYVTVVPDPDVPARLPSSSPMVFRYVNGEEATWSGGEIVLDHRAAPRFSWRGRLSWTWADDEESGEPVFGVAPLRGVVAVRWHGLAGRLWVDLAARFADRQDRVAVSRFEQETPGYTVYDLTARLELASGWTFRLGVENVTDKAYSHHLTTQNPFTGVRVPETGRSFHFGLGLRFSKKPPDFGKKRREATTPPRCQASLSRASLSRPGSRSSRCR